MNRVRILTHDLDAFEEVAATAAAAGFDPELAFAKDKLPAVPAALVYDLSSVTGDSRDRAALVAALLAAPLPGPTGVLSFQLGDEQVAALEAHGAVVGRTADRPFFARLLARVSPAGPAAA